MSIRLDLDLSTMTPKQGRAVALMIQAFFGSEAEVVVRNTIIAPADNPATGAPLPPTPATGAAVAQIPPPPPIPSAPPVPAASVASTPVSALPPSPPAVGAPSITVDIDATGLPWDTRLHATPPSKTAKNIWRAKRGLNDPAMVARVEGELRALMALPGPATGAAVPPIPAPAPVVPSVPPAPVVPSVPPAAPAVDPAAAIAFGTGVTATPPVPPVPNAAGPVDFPSLMVRLSPALASGALTHPALIEACKQVGVESLPLLANRPDLVPAVFAIVASKVAV